MGVKGLWRILEAARVKADLEQLRGKKIAIDMNIWLHQALKSKAKGNHNIHLVILFRRICKLLFYGIRPVFVFDGAVPQLKRKTMADRRTNRNLAQEKSIQARNKLLKRLFRRLAENNAKSKKPNKELTAEFLQRYNSTEAMRKAEIDVEIFGSQNSSIEAPAPSSSILHLESEQKSALRLAEDFVANNPSVDIHSDAFNALPMQAQLQVILILKDTALDVSPSVSGATFSQNQVQRLVMRRELSRKKEEIERKMNESLIAKVVPKELQSTPDMDVKAFRIASQDEGHAILLKRRSSKENAEDLKKRLEWLIAGKPKEEPSENQNHELKSEENSVFVPEVDSSQSKVDQESSDNEIFGKDASPESNGHKVPKSEGPASSSSSDTDEFVDVEEETSADIKALDALALRLIESQEANIPRLFPSTSQNIPSVSDPPVEFQGKEDLEIMSSEDESSSGESSDDDADRSISTGNASTEILSSFEHSASAEATQELESSVESHQEKGDITGVDQNPDSERLPEMSSFLASGFVDLDEDNLDVDDDVLRAEADRFERLAQETTSDCIEEAQRLVELFGFPIVVSPEEAEAQCCRLQQLGLVDVVASDDSDVWVFGASLVCRYLFGSDSGKGKSKSTSFYSSRDIKTCLGLDRRNLIQLALLCGSDYTSGIDKIGPVKALEIIATFCQSHKYPNRTEMDAVVQPLVIFRESCRRELDARWKNIKVPDDFPSEAVVNGYLSPKVEEPKDFHWETPQMALLVKYAMEKLGWSRQMSEGTLMSVLNKFKAMIEGGGVSSTPQITNFFPRVEHKLKSNSRLAQAADKLKYAREFENLPDFDDDWSIDDEKKEGGKPSNSSKKRKSSEAPKAVTKKRGKSK